MTDVSRRIRDGAFTLTRALRHRNYRLYVWGQGTSLVGTWITRVATGWLVYRLTGSELLLGVVGFAGQIPTLVLAPMAGVLVDRFDKRRLLLATQVAAMCQSLALAVLTIPGFITVTHVILLQLLQGIINALDAPTRQALVVELLDDPADLPNAIALNSSLVNLSRIAGPSIGGVLIALVGEGWCFALDGVSYLAVIASLLAMRLARRERSLHGTGWLDELREGFGYVSGFAPVRSALVLLALVAMLGMPYMVLMPVIAVEVLRGNASTLGLLMAATGVGALMGAVHLASRRTVRGLWRLIPSAAMLFGLALTVVSRSRSLPLTMLALTGAGAGMMLTMAATNTVLQTVVPPALRGRVMAFYAMAILGTAPLGSLAAGVVADRIGVPSTLLMGGIACVGAAAVFRVALPRLRAEIRAVYAERQVVL